MGQPKNRLQPTSPTHAHEARTTATEALQNVVERLLTRQRDAPRVKPSTVRLEHAKAKIRRHGRMTVADLKGWFTREYGLSVNSATAYANAIRELARERLDGLRIAQGGASIECPATLDAIHNARLQREREEAQRLVQRLDTRPPATHDEEDDDAQDDEPERAGRAHLDVLAALATAPPAHDHHEASAPDDSAPFNVEEAYL